MIARLKLSTASSCRLMRASTVPRLFRMRASYGVSRQRGVERRERFLGTF